MTKRQPHRAYKNSEGLRVRREESHREHIAEKRRIRALHRKDPTIWLEGEID